MADAAWLCWPTLQECVETVLEPGTDKEDVNHTIALNNNQTSS